MPILWVLLCLLGLPCISCASGVKIPEGPVHVIKTGPQDPDFAQARPSPVDRDELTIVMSAGEVELDFRKSDAASEAQLYTGIYEGLFSYDPANISARLAAAESYKVSEDRKTWTFTLRRRAKFSNGDPVRAEDFRASWLSILAMGEAAPYASLFDIIEGARDYRLGKVKNASKVGISAPDARTLVVKLVSPAPYLKSMLCHHSWSPVHPSMLARDDWDAGPVIGNGPFTLTENTEERKVLTKNEAYWDADNVALRQITLKYTSNGDESAALWNSGESRWIAGTVNGDALTDLSGIEVNPLFATHYYFICSTKKPFDQAKVRKALALALPWEELRDGYPLPAKTLVFPIDGYPAVDSGIVTDMAAAKALLAEAGFPGAKGLPELVLRIVEGDEKSGELMSAAWHEGLGVKVKVEVVSALIYFDTLRRTDYDVGSLTWIGDFADPYTFLQMWREDSNLNYAHFKDPDYEALLERAQTEENEKRLETMAAAEKLLLERGTVLPIYYSPAVNIVDTGELDGWYPNVLDIHPFKYFYFKDWKPLPGVAFFR